MSARYFVGLDLGQARDYSALAVLEVEGFGLHTILRVRHLQRWKLGTSYPQICDETCILLHRAPLQSAPLIVDATGVGRPVVDLFKPRLGARLNAAMITGGSAETKNVIERVPYWTIQNVHQLAAFKYRCSPESLRLHPIFQMPACLCASCRTFK
ncbi:hypothetical protein BH20ACI3_BH20ACI3_39740 [soil metagenome]